MFGVYAVLGKLSRYQYTVPGNMLTPVCVIQSPHKPMESVLLNPVALGKAISKGDEENLNLITVSSVWEQKAVVMKEADFSATFLFSCRGVSGGTKRGNMKSITM